MENKKILAAIIGVAATICLALGIVGLLESKKKPVIKPQRTYQVTYKYYLNDVEVSQMPTNPTLISSEEASSETGSTLTNNVEKLYAFNTANCTNNVEYTWNEDTWTFKPANTADTTCSLYFVTTYNTLKIEATNAKITTPTEVKVNRGEDTTIKITPDEGYVYEDTVCTNNEVAEWNSDGKELTIRNVVATTSCSAKFKMSSFTLEIEVSNGTGTTKVEYNYGTKIETTVTPAEGYGNPKISCTNDQKGVWKDNSFTIEKLTGNSKCKVDFEKLQTKVSYTASLDVGEHGALSSGASAMSVLEGASVSWTVTAYEGYVVDSTTCTAGKSIISGTNPYVIKLEDIDSDAECTVNYQQQTQPTNTEE